VKGTMLIVSPDGVITSVPLTEMPHHTELHKHVGGPLETVPYFNWVKWPTISISRHKCVAFCNEDGKRLNLPRNHPAEKMWLDALQRAGMPTEIDDYLVGTVVVLFGDKQFMEAL
jgi:hypothetical protein